MEAILNGYVGGVNCFVAVVERVSRVEGGRRIFYFKWTLIGSRLIDTEGEPRLLKFRCQNPNFVYEFGSWHISTSRWRRAN